MGNESRISKCNKDIFDKTSRRTKYLPDISNFYQRLNDVVGEMKGIKKELEESKDIDAICLSNQFAPIINNIKLALEKLSQIDNSI